MTEEAIEKNKLQQRRRKGNERMLAACQSLIKKYKFAKKGLKKAELLVRGNKIQQEEYEVEQRKESEEADGEKQKQSQNITLVMGWRGGKCPTI